MRAVKYDAKQHPTLNDKGVKLLNSFVRSMPLADLRNCADVSTLFVKDIDYYGFINHNDARTLDCGTHQSVIPKSSTTFRLMTKCSFTNNLNYCFSFGQALAQHFGARLNTDSEAGTGYNYGHVIKVKEVDNIYFKFTSNYSLRVQATEPL